MKVLIKAVRQTVYDDLSAAYENPLSEPCSLKVGQEFLSDGTMPEGFCPAAWETIAPFAASLARGEGNLYDGWMRDPLTALLSCNDGVRPMTFLLRAVPES